MKRIQRKRTKGFKLPENTVCVDRTTKWGNPYKVVKESGNWYVKDQQGNYWSHSAHKNDAASKAVDIYRGWIDGQIGLKKLDITELRGKNLACFCPPDSPCHADYLLEAANYNTAEQELADKIIKELEGAGFSYDEMIKVIRMARAKYEEMKAKTI